MTVSLYELSVSNYLQTLGAVAGFLDGVLDRSKRRSHPTRDFPSCGTGRLFVASWRLSFVPKACSSR